MEGPREKLSRLDAPFWTGALIWAGLVFGAENLGFLPQIGKASAWSLIFLGGGIAGLGLSLYSLSAVKYSNPTTWDWIFGAVLLAVGLGGFLGVDIGLPVILIVAGLATLVNAFMRRQ
ncbi:MAG: hypothetical protein GTO14_11005 [Anaerolineales bacterium]|nr:hypothetical protein [Anaerolineales bacterium]